MTNEVLEVEFGGEMAEIRSGINGEVWSWLMNKMVKENERKRRIVGTFPEMADPHSVAASPN